MSVDNCARRSNDKDHALGFLLCLFVIAYIYHFHTTQQQAAPPKEQSEDPIEPTPVAAPPTPTPHANIHSTIQKPYDQGFHDGLKTNAHFGVAEIYKSKTALQKQEHDSKERERRMEKKLADFERECIQMENTIKTWREDYLRALWEVKQKGEGGLLNGWFRFRSPRASEKMAKGEDRDSVFKAGEERPNEKEVQYDDMKKG